MSGRQAVGHSTQRAAACTPSGGPCACQAACNSHRKSRIQRFLQTEIEGRDGAGTDGMVSRRQRGGRQRGKAAPVPQAAASARCMPQTALFPSIPQSAPVGRGAPCAAQPPTLLPPPGQHCASCCCSARPRPALRPHLPHMIACLLVGPPQSRAALDWLAVGRAGACKGSGGPPPVSRREQQPWVGLEIGGRAVEGTCFGWPLTRPQHAAWSINGPPGPM